MVEIRLIFLWAAVIEAALAYCWRHREAHVSRAEIASGSIGARVALELDRAGAPVLHLAHCFGGIPRAIVCCIDDVIFLRVSLVANHESASNNNMEDNSKNTVSTNRCHFPRRRRARGAYNKRISARCALGNCSRRK